MIQTIIQELPTMIVQSTNLKYATSQGQWFISTIGSADAGMGVDIELNQNETSMFACEWKPSETVQ